MEDLSYSDVRAISNYMGLGISGSKGEIFDRIDTYIKKCNADGVVIPNRPLPPTPVDRPLPPLPDERPLPPASVEDQLVSPPLPSLPELDLSGYTRHELYKMRGNLLPTSPRKHTGDFGGYFIFVAGVKDDILAGILDELGITLVNDRELNGVVHKRAAIEWLSLSSEEKGHFEKQALDKYFTKVTAFYDTLPSEYIDLTETLGREITKRDREISIARAKANPPNSRLRRIGADGVAASVRRKERDHNQRMRGFEKMARKYYDAWVKKNEEKKAPERAMTITEQEKENIIAGKVVKNLALELHDYAATLLGLTKLASSGWTPRPSERVVRLMREKSIPWAILERISRTRASSKD